MKILIVEDNPGDTGLLRREFDKFCLPGEVESADTIANAVAMMNAVAFDGMILDLGLTDSTGPETVSKVRREFGPCIVVYTGSASEEVGVRAVRFGADAFFGKNDVDHGAVVRNALTLIEKNTRIVKLERAVKELNELKEMIVAPLSSMLPKGVNG